MDPQVYPLAELQERYGRLGLILKKRGGYYEIYTKDKPKTLVCKFEFLRTVATELNFREVMSTLGLKHKMLEKVTQN